MSDRVDRLVDWAERRPQRIGGHNPWAVLVGTLRESIDDRVPGLAAEMAFFALLSMAPLLVAVGAGFGYMERVVGAEQIARIERALLDGLGVVFTSEVIDDVLGPLVRGLLQQQRSGIAITGLAITLWLASRVFSATIRALDLAFDAHEGRPLIKQRALAVLFALVSVVVVVVTLTFLIIGPLLGGGQDLAERLGLGDAFALAWGLGRWPLLVVLGVGFLATVYRYGPAQRTPWSGVIPGALLALVLWTLVSIGFRIYLDVGAVARFDAGEAAEAVAAGMLGSVVAAVLWVYLSSMTLLLGGELNAELQRRRARAP